MQVAIEDVTDFEYGNGPGIEYDPGYPPHIILEVKCSEIEAVPRFPGCKLTMRDRINNSEIGYYQLPSSSGS